MEMTHVSFSGTVKPDSRVRSSVHRDLFSGVPKEINLWLGDANIYIHPNQAAKLVGRLERTLDEFHHMWGHPLRIIMAYDVTI
jgi:hypothetical protein